MAILETIHLRKALIKLAIAFVSLFTLLFVVHATLSFNRKNEEAKKTTQNLAKTLHEYIGGVFDRADLSIQKIKYLLISTDSQKSDSTSNILLEFQNIKNEMLELEVIALASADGKYQFNSIWNDRKDLEQVQKKMSLADRPYFIQQKQSDKDELIISEPIFSRTTGNQIITVSRKITNKKGAFSGLVIATINLKKISEFFSNLNVGAGGVVSLFNGNNILLARSPFSEEDIGKKFHLSDDLKKLNEDGISFGTISATSPIDNKSRIFSFIESESTKLRVVVGVSKDELLKNWMLEMIGPFILYISLVFLTGFLILRLIQNMNQVEFMSEKLKINDKLSTLGELAAGIGHEIKNPLSVMIGRAGSMTRDIDRSSESGQRLVYNIESIIKNGNRILKIIDSLKAYARNSDADPFIEIDFFRIFEEAHLLIQERAKNEAVQISSLISHQVFVKCRESQLVQVLINLLNNSIDALVGQSKREITCEGYPINGFFIFKITDTGLGVPNEIRSKIFEAFYTSKPLGKGTGLGLSISKKIIEDHGGRLYLNESSKLTQFIFEIPLS